MEKCAQKMKPANGVVTFFNLIAIVLVYTAIFVGVSFAQSGPPGGFFEKSFAPDTTRQSILTQSQINAFLNDPVTGQPARRKFTFPAPYNSEGVRITIPSDCAGQDCVGSVGYSYWRNINNHQNDPNNLMYIFLPLDHRYGGGGITLFSYNKVNDQVQKVKQLFADTSTWVWFPGGGWYFSATRPTTIYLSYDPGINAGITTKLFRYDVTPQITTPDANPEASFETVFDIATRTDLFGPNRYIEQFHSSNDDTAHSATIRDASDFSIKGCMVYQEPTSGRPTAKWFFFQTLGLSYDECQIDKSGNWLLIKEKVFVTTNDFDNRIINLSQCTSETQCTEMDLSDADGAAGHSDNGYATMVGADNAAAGGQFIGAVRLWNFTQPLQNNGAVVYYTGSWSISGPHHISYANARGDIPANQQYVCGSGADLQSAGPEASEIICFRLDGSFDVLVVAPSMTNNTIPATHCNDGYCLDPKANLDVTGKYMIWASNMGGNRMDAFIAKIPAQKLSTLQISNVSASSITSTGATITWTTNLSGDSQVEYGTTTAYGSSTNLDTTMVTSHSQQITGLSPSTLYHFRVNSRDAAGNLATSGDFTFTTSATGGGLPSPWTSQDIGSVAFAGSATYASGTFTVQASGSDIWNTADAFRFVYQPLDGNGQIIARVASVTNTDAWTKAGVMIRESLAAGSKHAMMGITPGNGTTFPYRLQTDGSSASQTPFDGLVAPYWVKIVRSGNTFTGYKSSDGVNWTQIGSQTITMAANVYIGLALTSHNNAAVATATFDNVSVVTNGQFADQDIGSVAFAGSSSFSNGTFTVQASGNDIWNTADAFHFVYETLAGDGNIVARLVSLGNTDAWAKAGVMMRETLMPGSKHAMMGITPGNGTTFPYRLQTDGVSASQTPFDGLVAPYWVKLVRSGNTFTGYKSSDGITWVQIGSQTIAMGATIYVGLALTSHNNAAVVTATFDNVVISEWADEDIGSVAFGGSASFSGGTFTLKASGSDIWNTADAFHYAHEPLVGDGQIIARVASVTNTDAWTKAGVMIRESLAAGSRHAMMGITPGNGTTFPYRLQTDGSSASQTPFDGLVAPYWVKIVRSGNTFTGYKSSDGVNWTQVGSQTITMGTTVYIGLALTSHNNAAVATATFDNVQ